MSSPLSYEATSEILQSIRIPSAPAAFMELHALMQQDEPDIDAVAATISRDPGLSALVLKTLNSPFSVCATRSRRFARRPCCSAC